jgi:hypothetical protein
MLTSVLCTPCIMFHKNIISNFVVEICRETKWLFMIRVCSSVVEQIKNQSQFVCLWNLLCPVLCRRLTILIAPLRKMFCCDDISLLGLLLFLDQEDYTAEQIWISGVTQCHSHTLTTSCHKGRSSHIIMKYLVPPLHIPLRINTNLPCYTKTYATTQYQLSVQNVYSSAERTHNTIQMLSAAY